MYCPFKKNRKSSSDVEVIPDGADAVTAEKLAVEFPIKVVFLLTNCFLVYSSKVVTVVPIAVPFKSKEELNNKDNSSNDDMDIFEDDEDEDYDEANSDSNSEVVDGSEGLDKFKQQILNLNKKDEQTVIVYDSSKGSILKRLKSRDMKLFDECVN